MPGSTLLTGIVITVAAFVARRFRRLLRGVRTQEEASQGVQKLVFGLDVTGCIYMLHPLRTRTQRSCERTHLRLHTLGVRTHTLSVLSELLCTRTPPRAPPRLYGADKRKYAGENAGETYAPICGIYTPDAA